MKVLLLLLVLARCRSFLVVPAPRVLGIPSVARGGTGRAARSRPVPSRRAQHRGQTRRYQAAPGMSPEELNKARESLISSKDFEQMVNRVDSSPSPLAEKFKMEGVSEEDVKPTPFALLRQIFRAVVDVVIVLVPVVLAATFATFPPPVLEALGSAAGAVQSSPLEPVLAALPWEPIVVLKSVAQGGVAILLSPVADWLVVSPVLHLWAQIRIRSLTNST